MDVGGRALQEQMPISREWGHGSFLLSVKLNIDAGGAQRRVPFVMAKGTKTTAHEGQNAQGHFMTCGVNSFAVLTQTDALKRHNIAFHWPLNRETLI